VPTRSPGLIMRLIEYSLGISANLYSSLPASDHGKTLFAVAAWASTAHNRERTLPEAGMDHSQPISVARRTAWARHPHVRGQTEVLLEPSSIGRTPGVTNASGRL
jgi:hypothetical protein